MGRRVTSPTTELDDIRERLEDEAPGSGAQLFDATLAAARRYCGWRIFPPETETIRLDGPGSSLIQLPSLHVVDVEEVRQLYGPEWETVEVSWSQTGLMRRRRGCFTDEYRGIEVTLTHGFEDAPDVLKVLSDACHRELENPMRLASKKVGERQEAYATSGLSGVLFGSEFSVLDLYRLNKEV